MLVSSCKSSFAFQIGPYGHHHLVFACHRPTGLPAIPNEAELMDALIILIIERFSIPNKLMIPPFRRQPRKRINSYMKKDMFPENSLNVPT